MKSAETHSDETRRENRSLILIGALVTLGGLVWLGNTVSFVQRAEESRAIVLRTETRQTKNNIAHFPVFRFTDSLGMVRTQRSSSGVGFWKPRPGAEVTILYNPADPQDAAIHSFVNLWLGPVALVAVGLVLAGAAFSPALRRVINSGNKAPASETASKA